jgi:phosphoglycolate phosphatase-like HAD superfamily hydrolase
MRTLVLFDIDGTLVRGGPAKVAFQTAMMHAFGTAGDIRVHDFAGKTDPQIARELLTGVGLSPEQIDEGFPRLWPRYTEELEARLQALPMERLAGVEELLDALEAAGDVALGLLTGNIARGARLKLDSVGIGERFSIGSYGSDHEVREHLPAIALERASLHHGVAFEKDRVFVIGDTPRDVACGLHEGVRTVGVATGRYDTAALTLAGAHRSFPDLRATEDVLAYLLA